MTTTITRAAEAAATVAREGTTTRGLYGTLSAAETPIELVHRWREGYERRVRTLEAQVAAQAAALTVLRRMLRGEPGALPYTREAALALVEQGLAATEDEARERLNSWVAGMQADPEHP